ncbi:aminoglycoside adenylyltransferase family protein [Kerstersia sp.]|uniref:aminoglycoside adenylyltransferase family protein n=1 Tax=Kerstersia sp. TaxID=1930783 RepID=UPI003F8E62B9
MILQAPVSIQAQLSRTLAALKQHLGGSVRAIHLFGSAVDGGLKPLSDIDLLVTVDEAPGALRRKALMRDLLLISAFPGTDPERRALEVTVLAQEDVLPWRYPARRQMQFGEWLRADLEAGVFEHAMADPDLAILLTKVRRHSLALHGPAAQRFFDPVPAGDVRHALLQTLAQWQDEADWAGDESNIVLALARIWYTSVTGDIAAKDVAAEWALQRVPQPHKPVLVAARDGYRGLAAADLAACSQERAALLAYIRSCVEDGPR